MIQTLRPIKPALNKRTGRPIMAADYPEGSAEFLQWLAGVASFHYGHPIRLTRVSEDVWSLPHAPQGTMSYAEMKTFLMGFATGADLMRKEIKSQLDSQRIGSLFVGQGKGTGR